MDPVAPPAPPGAPAHAPADSTPGALAVGTGHSTALHACLTALIPLRFGAPAPEDDLPGHVRGASAVRRWAGRLVVVQDDVRALARLDAAAGICTPVLLPAGAGGRRTFGTDTGNKQHKLDLEAATVLPDGRLLALGSGSRPARERLVLLSSDGAVREVAAGALYAEWHRRRDFAGAELNLEGCVCRGDHLLLFQRGNGAARPGQPAINATAEVPLAAFLAWLDHGAPPPGLRAVVAHDLGQVEGVPLGFTDAAHLPDGRVAFIAGAEASPDTYQDGAVLGAAFGVLEPDGSLRLTPVRTPEGGLSRLKLEGLEWQDSASDQTTFAVVVDLDDTAQPARLGTLVVRGL